jgi:hypothetical protein
MRNLNSYNGIKVPKWIHSIKIICIAVIAACFWTAGSAHAQSVCGTQSPVSVNNNTYHVQNNEFDSSATECINVNGTIFNITQSAIANATNSSPGAYPSIYIGCHWGSCTANSNLPVQISAMTDARSDWNTTQPTSGAYDAAYDIWINTTPTTAGQPDGAEVMIWLNYRGTIQPFGNPVSPATIGGASYNVYEGPETSGGTTWNVISYQAQNTTLSASNLDIQAFINDAVNRGYVSASWYLIAIEAGFELWQGGAGLSTNSFSTTVNNSLGTSPLNIGVPSDGSVLSGTATFKAALVNSSLSSYQMYWSVDGGGFNAMSDNTTNADKEFSVDLSGWTWRDAGNYYGPFAVTFTAEDLSGNIRQQKTVIIYRAK